MKATKDLIGKKVTINGHPAFSSWGNEFVIIDVWEDGSVICDRQMTNSGNKIGNLRFEAAIEDGKLIINK